MLSPHSQPLMCCRRACEAYHLLETKRGCQQTQMATQDVLHWSQELSKQHAWTAMRLDPFGKPGWFRQHYATHRGNFPTLDQLAVHQKHVKTCSWDRSSEARSSTSFLQGQSCAIQARRITVANRLMSHSYMQKQLVTLTGSKTALHTNGFFNSSSSCPEEICKFLLYTLQPYLL